MHCDKTVIEGATELQQQSELDEYWTIYTTFYIMRAIHVMILQYEYETQYIKNATSNMPN